MLLGLFLPLPIFALHCVGGSEKNLEKNKLKPFYVPGDHYEFDCDTMTVQFGATTTFWEGGTVFVGWNEGLSAYEKVLLVQGTLIGMGRLEIRGSSLPGNVPSRWGGIILDSCGLMNFNQLDIIGATTPLTLKSSRATVANLTLESSGAILLPDFSKLSVHPKSDVLGRFAAYSLPGMENLAKDCPEESGNVTRAESQETGQPEESYGPPGVAYWISIIGIGVLAGVLAFYMRELK